MIRFIRMTTSRLLSLQSSTPNAIARRVPAVATFRAKASAVMTDGGLANWGLSMGRQRLGALTLQNHPLFLQNLVMPRLGTATGTIDVAALDLIRDRERGRYYTLEWKPRAGAEADEAFLAR